MTASMPQDRAYLQLEPVCMVQEYNQFGIHLKKQSSNVRDMTPWCMEMMNSLSSFCL
jgi:hypothetical protein